MSNEWSEYSLTSSLNDDCLGLVLRDGYDGKTFKALLMTCMRFYAYFVDGPAMILLAGTTASEKYWRLVERYSNHVATRIKLSNEVGYFDNYIAPEWFIRENIGMDWSWDDISKRENLSLAFIEEFIDKIKLRQTIWYNENITEEFVRKHHCRGWTPSTVPLEDIVGGFVPRYPSDVKAAINRHINEFADYDHVIHLMASHPAVTLDVIRDNADFEWSKEGLASNPNVTLEDMPELLPLWGKSDIKMTAVSDMTSDQIITLIKRTHSASLRSDMVAYLPLHLAEQHMDWDDWKNIQERSDLTLDFIMRHRDKMQKEYYTQEAHIMLGNDIIGNLDLIHSDIFDQDYFDYSGMSWLAYYSLCMKKHEIMS